MGCEDHVAASVDPGKIKWGWDGGRGCDAGLLLGAQTLVRVAVAAGCEAELMLVLRLL